MMDELANKTVVITGASSGIGAATAHAFLAAGTNVFATYNNNTAGMEEVVNALPNRRDAIATGRYDLCEEGSAGRILEDAMERFGAVHVLVNNAGDMLGRQLVADSNTEHFNRVFDLNAKSVYWMSRSFARHFRENGSGNIINTSSIAARIGASGGGGLYGAAKAYVSSLTRVLARELAPFGIRANAVAPGVIETAFHQRNSQPDQLEALRQNIPLGRLGTPEDCAGAFLFLACDSLSG